MWYLLADLPRGSSEDVYRLFRKRGCKVRSTTASAQALWLLVAVFYTHTGLLILQL
jgi:hypothetical protein